MSNIVNFNDRRLHRDASRSFLDARKKALSIGIIVPDAKKLLEEKTIFNACKLVRLDYVIRANYLVKRYGQK